VPEENSQNSNSKKFKILLTSFEPMPDSDGVNMSAEVAKSIKAPDGVEVVLVTLPNDYEKAKELLDKAVAENSPDYVISLGENNFDYAGEEPKEFYATVETAAQGFIGAPDKIGCSLEEYPLFMNKDKVYIECRNEMLNEYLLNNYAKNENFKLDLHINNEASDYLCNFTFYSALTAMENSGRQGQAAFLHLADPMSLRDGYNVQNNLAYKTGTEFYARMVEDMMVYIKNNSQSGVMAVNYKTMGFDEYVQFSTADLNITDSEKMDINNTAFLEFFGFDVEDLFKEEIVAIETIKIGELTPPGCPYDVKIKQPSAKPVR
jgi:pyrrolidone-carboxylate peptidase